MAGFIALDVETPNYGNNGICAIGMTPVENGRLGDTRYWLVNPESFFSAFNVRIHGITPRDVKTAPTFPELWRAVLEPALAGKILAAHNAAFDLGVLARCLNRYGISRENDCYVCTLRMGRKFLKEAPNHRLNTLCDLLGFDLLHHNAGSDSRACASLLLYYLEQGFPVRDCIRQYRYGAQFGTVPRSKSAN